MTAEIDFSHHLNPEQLEAVETVEGPVLVIAGAGSGKTRTLVFRVAKLIHAGIPADQILLLTFTRKAAQTMLERAAELVGHECRNVAGGTFHGFSHRMLRRYAHLAGLPNNFTIMDRGDVQDLFHLLSRQLDLTGSGSRFPKKGTLASIYSKAINMDLDVTQILERAYPHLLIHRDGILAVMDAYKNYKKQHGLVDYDDLLLLWKNILEDNSHVRASVGDQFKYIMVDEYQDTNRFQAEITRLMACGHDNVMAVGDDAQSIYSFRGANFKNIMDFPRLFPGCRIIKLERNYRTTQPNLDCTNAIIASAKEKFTKRLVAIRKGGKPPLLFLAKDEEDQARFVASRIVELKDKGLDLHEMAVLFRAAFHSFRLEAELAKRGIPFVKRGGLKLVESAHIKDFLALIKVMINPMDRLSLNRSLLLIDGLGPKGIDKIFGALIKAEEPLSALADYQTRAKWGPTVRELGRILVKIQNAPLGLEDLLKVLGAWYRPYLEKVYPDDYPKRQQELDQLLALASGYEDAVTFLSDIALDPPEQEEEKKGGKLVLSTIHSAKGLEWDTVFVISLAEGRFPSPQSAHSSDELEEERRLFYVAATRAKNNLFFTSPGFINVSGAGIMPAKPSRFLDDIPGELIKKWRYVGGEREATGNRFHYSDALHTGRGARPGAAQEDGQTPRILKDDGRQVFETGTRVRHPVFGPGTVVKTMGSSKIVVSFPAVGEKTLHLEFAKLSIL